MCTLRVLVRARAMNASKQRSHDHTHFRQTQYGRLSLSRGDAFRSASARLDIRFFSDHSINHKLLHSPCLYKAQEAPTITGCNAAETHLKALNIDKLLKIGISPTPPSPCRYLACARHTVLHSAHANRKIGRRNHSWTARLPPSRGGHSKSTAFCPGFCHRQNLA